MSHSPVRTSAGPNFAQVSGKSTMSQPSGLSLARSAASVSNVAASGFQRIVFPIVPPASCQRFPNASARPAP